MYQVCNSKKLEQKNSVQLFFKTFCIFFKGDELKLKLKAKLEKFLEGNNKETLQTSQIKPKSETSAISGLISIPSRKEYSEIVCEEPYGKPGFYDNTVIDTWLDPAKSDCKGNIAIVGQSQIGKTQLLKKILLDVKDKYDYVFLVTLKSFDLSKSGFVLKLLTCNKSDVPYIDNVGDQQEADCKKVINNLIIGSLNEENPIKICIVFDHWENVTLFNKQESNSNVSFLSKAPFHDFLQRILEEGFANSKLLMLLNPWQFYQLKHKVKYIIFVEGINYADQEQLVSNKALSCTRAGCKLKACCGCVIKKHERNQCSICCHCHEDNCHHELQSLCFVPENCKKLRSFLRYPQSTVVHQAFLIFFDNIVKKYLNQINWYEIGMFAWKSYKNKDFTFHELELLKLPDTVINILFNCKSENLLDTLSFDRIFFFSHVLLHEFLAALGLLSFPIQNFKDELKAYKAAFVDGSFAVVCEFMSEICKDSSLMRFLCNRIDLKHDNFVELVEVLPTSVIPKHGLT